MLGKPFKQLFVLLPLLLTTLVIPNLASVSWGAWSAWTVSCSVTCGTGHRSRQRQCIDGFGKVYKVSSCGVGKPAEYTNCMISSKCPRQPGWSKWGEWGDCTRIEQENKARSTSKPMPHGCLPGNKIRTRLCNHPPPDLGPNSILCAGKFQEIKRCHYGCLDTPPLDEYNINAKINHQIQIDHVDARVHRQQVENYDDVVKIRAVGDDVEFECNTKAHKLATELLESRFLSASKMGLPTRQLQVAWRLGGRIVVMNRIKKNSRSEIRNGQDESLERVENEYVAQMKRSEPIMEGTKLILKQLNPDDTGFYSCHLSIGKREWAANFYSLIVLGKQIFGTALMPFYLHSNMGLRNPLAESKLHWYDAARITWTLNGEEKFTDLLTRTRVRIRYVDQLKDSFQGQWNCFLIIPLPDSPTRQALENLTIATTYLINSFYLGVDPSPPSLWELGSKPERVKRLRLVAILVINITIGLAIAVGLTIWAVRRWTSRVPLIEQLESAVEEVIEERTRIFLTANHRARINWRFLVQLINQAEFDIDKQRYDAYLRAETTQLETEQEAVNLKTT